MPEEVHHVVTLEARNSKISCSPSSFFFFARKVTSKSVLQQGEFCALSRVLLLLWLIKIKRLKCRLHRGRQRQRDTGIMTTRCSVLQVRPQAAYGRVAMACSASARSMEFFLSPHTELLILAAPCCSVLLHWCYSSVVF